MLRFLKWLLGAAVVLVLCVVGAYVLSRVLGALAAEREALALLDEPPAPPERDGFAALYTASHDIPEAGQASLVAEEVRRFKATPLGRDGSSDWSSLLQERPSLVVARDGDPAWCNLRSADCLEQVRGARDAYAGLLERNARALERAGALHGYDGFPNPFPPRLDMPLPGFQVLTRLMTRTAWRFAEGQADLALADACRDVAMGRQLIESGDSLIGSMIGAAMVQGNAQLLAQMLAELPREHALPEQCRQAFGRPVALEQGVCRTMLSEGRFVAGGLRTQINAEVAASAVEREVPAWALRLLFDPERTAARMAPTFAWYCGEEARGQLAQDQLLRAPPANRSHRSFRCLSNAIGCVLADIASPAYADYGMRMQDADARLRTVAALLWLRDQDGPIDAAALERVPVALRSPARPFQLDPEAGTLGTEVFWAKGAGANGTWPVPLPASRLQPAAPSP
ncbi:hypothetical protein [Pseudoxanthomonas sp. J35]|uniref:hypothetical protein n=1 Tax=Pseudoxanthomonas sp. J35 TaxID=935852 RepID=UPI00048C4144|nr:hypothetical protein [Pseudoxanthomonas sp. J35]